MPARFTPWVTTLALLAAAASLRAQDAVARAAGATSAAAPPIVTASFAPDGWVAADSAIVLTLDRPLGSEEGHVAVLVGGTDVTTLFERRGRIFRYRARSLRLPAGAGEVAVFSVKSGRWTELARLPIRVLTSRGYTSAEVRPGLSVNNKGQLAEGHAGSQQIPSPATWQDVGFSGGLQTSHQRGGWTLRTQSNYVGVSRRQEALRFALRQDGAPKVDLADYSVQLERGPARLSLGNVTEGANRHLINGFASRGAELRIGGTAASLALAATSGSSLVGWENFTGLSDASHRIASGTLAFELVPSRPGAIHLDATLLRGALRPQTSFTQGGVVDAERSTGSGVQLAAATPSQRLRLVAGLSSSRFESPARDPQLTGDTAVVAVRPERRAAYYVEANAGLLQNVALPHLFATTLNAGYRLERVDPLYRSVAAAVQADRVVDAFQVDGSLGALAIQVVHSRDHDNLANVPSILKTYDRLTTASASVPVATLVRARSGAAAALLPVVTYGFNRVHQYGAGIPVGGDFNASHVPDQQTDVHDASAAWQLGRFRVQYRFNQSDQDNRQTGRERADFLAVTSTLSIDVAARADLDVGLEGGAEHQTSRENAETNRVRRAGGTVTWRPTPLTTLTAFASSTTTRTDPLSASGSNWDMRLELARGFDLWQYADGRGTRGQAFLRWANTTADQRTYPLDLSFVRDRRRAWTLTSGLTFRLY